MPVKIIDAAESAVKEGSKPMFIKSYGCQMNQYDAIRMAELMRPHGYYLADAPDGADLVVYNTCHIREKADEKVFSDVGRFKRAADENAIHAVGGCVGQAMGDALMKRQPAVRVVFGPQTIHRLPEFVEQVNRYGRTGKQARVVDTDFPELEKFDKLPTPGAYGPSAFVTIQEGCDKFCTYCVVPYTRGAEISRSVADVVAECRHLADQGVKELVLLGQNVNAFHGEDESGVEVSFAGLLRRVAEIDGVERVRFTTSHPQNMAGDLINLFGEEEKLMPYFHLPVQAGSDRILAAMNRSHTAAEYIEIIERLRAVRPDIAISGDFIVGFPGETEEDFEQTLAVAAEVDYASAYSFAYSPRPGTPAAAMPNQVDEVVKKERLAGLQALLNDQQEAFNRRFIGQTIPVLVEERGSKPNQLRGRSAHNVAVNFNGTERLIGHTVMVNVADGGLKSLFGDIQLAEDAA